MRRKKKHQRKVHTAGECANRPLSARGLTSCPHPPRSSQTIDAILIRSPANSFFASRCGITCSLREEGWSGSGRRGRRKYTKKVQNSNFGTLFQRVKISFYGMLRASKGWKSDYLTFRVGVRRDF
ncbi:hypothetical protein CDAR_458241 [Caerostris darwini]|uniref:Uncharacterized protein n=1 Tax=Caerostris darwini TaxID=1538125 RepID=A0AAV4TRF2_9ARAC|nr:hypothetical protein CDAR_458241 [Caerostris darwini]